jgi:sodium transport system permease protein
MGKWLAACFLSTVTALLTMIYTLVALSFVPAERIGLSLALSNEEIGLSLAALLPLSLLFPAMQILVASFARTVREAQTYLSLAIFLPMLPALLTALAAVEVAPWMAVVPVLGQQALLTAMIRGETFELAAYAIATASALVTSFACVELTAWLFRRERIVYGR